MITDEIIYIISIYITSLLYSILEGKREAYYYDCKGFLPNDDKIVDYNEHAMFTAQRALFYAIITLASFIIFKNDIWLTAVITFALCVQFPFLHDGMYYYTRNRIDGTLYKKKWFDQSTTSTASTERFLTPVNRTIGFLIGTLLIVCVLLVMLTPHAS